MDRRVFLSLLASSAVKLGSDTAEQEANKNLGSSPKIDFIVMGDTGTGDEAQYTLGRMMALQHRKEPFDTALMLGDNLYPDGNLAEVAAKFERPYAALLERGVKFHAVLGNHDLRKGRTAQPAYRNFNMSSRAYYSFSKGDGLAEFFALDSTDFGRIQKSWLESSLAESHAKWKIAYFHHPIYSSARTHGSDLRLRAELEPLLLKYHVDAVFSGHDHTYERTKPQQGVQYFVSGTGGKLRRNDLNRSSLFFAAGNDQIHSFMSVEITPERFSYKTIDVAGRVIDEGTKEPGPI